MTTGENISNLADRYKEASQLNKSIYLDADEFDELAEYFDTNGDIDLAREVVSSGLQIHPKSLPLLLKKAKFVVYDGDYAKALNMLVGISAYDVDLYLIRIECYLQLGLLAEALELTQKILDTEESDLDNLLAELGFLYLESDLYNEAILYFEKSLEFESENIDVLSDLTYAYEILGNFDKAISVSNKVLDIDSYNYDAWVNLGKLYSLIEEYEKALDAFDFALTIRDDDQSILEFKGYCLSAIGRIPEAIELFNSIIEADTANLSTYFLLSECYQSLGLFDEALAHLERYKEVADEGIEYVIKKVQLLLAKGDVQLALNLIDSEMANYDDSLDLHIMAAEIKLQQRLYDDAEEYLLNVYFDNEDDFTLLDMLSIINIKKENYEQAIIYTEHLLDIDPLHLEVKQRLALLYFEVDHEELFNHFLEQFTDKELLTFFQFIYNLIKRLISIGKN